MTIGIYKHACVLGKINNGNFRLTKLGEIVMNWYDSLEQRFTNVETGLIQLMPNHIHVIIRLLPDFMGRGNRAKDIRASVTTIQDVPKQVILSNIPETEMSGRGNRAPTPGSLGQIVAYWKYNVTKEINCRGGVAPPLFEKNWGYLFEGKFFQRNYYERVIRDNKEKEQIEKYVLNNPKLWEKEYGMRKDF